MTLHGTKAVPKRNFFDTTFCQLFLLTRNEILLELINRYKKSHGLSWFSCLLLMYWYTVTKIRSQTCWKTNFPPNEVFAIIAVCLAKEECLVRLFFVQRWRDAACWSHVAIILNIMKVNERTFSSYSRWEKSKNALNNRLGTILFSRDGRWNLCGIHQMETCMAFSYSFFPYHVSLCTITQ